MVWHNATARQTVSELGVDPRQGLSKQEAAKRLDEHGANSIAAKGGKPLILRFFAQFKDFMIIILLLAAAVSFGVSLLAGEADFVDPIIIFAIVLVNATIGLVQESRAEKAIAALKAMAAPRAHVLRDGGRVTLDSADVVPGDILLLEAGDFVVADARLCETHTLAAEESSLTGESLPVDKDASAIARADAMPGERLNMVFSGSLITGGRGRAVVCATGMNTEVGKIATMLADEDSPDTPLQRRLGRIGKLLGVAALAICGCIFAMGVVQQSSILDSFMISISLAVAAIPEGLPAVVTIVLALGVQRMAGKKAIIRKLPAVETLGAATVICSDKTGTLTQNRMTVTVLADQTGEFPPSNGARLLTLAALCTDCEANGLDIVGEPTEVALVDAARRAGAHKSRLDTEFPRVGEIPFSSERKRMTTVHRLPDGGARVIVKGAPDVLLPLCGSSEQVGGRRTLDSTSRRALLEQNAAMADRALRVLAVAYKDLPSVPSRFDAATLENGLTFAGFCGMIDPPRPEAKQAVLLCKRAGITPVMITGDHKNTAAQVARELGILDRNGLVLSGNEIEQMDASQLAAAVAKTRVFARVSPEHKSRIVKAYQSRGEVVAMTGDGVNDAPALKIADIGCAMGISGTDVARGAADMILADDNFATIVEAVREGRGIFENIRRSVHYLLSCNVGEILIVFVAFLFGLPSPLLPIQLLWVNLVTDSLPALALGVEPIDKGIMNRKPLDPKKGLFSGGLSVEIALQGMLIGGLSLLGFLLGMRYFDLSVARTMAFTILSLCQLVHAFNVRCSGSVLRFGLLSNRALNGAALVCAVLQMAVVTVPAAAALFKVVPLTMPQIAIVAALSLLPLVAVELAKRLSARRDAYTFGTTEL